MTGSPHKLSRFWQELKRRRVVHVITVYASSAFVIIEGINNLAEPFNLSPSLFTIVVIVLAVGFPLAAILSWLYDLTSEGFEKTRPIEEVERIFEEQGFVAAYEEVLHQSEEMAQNGYFSPVEMAIRYMMIDQMDKAMDWIEKGFEVREPNMVYIATPGYLCDPLFDNPRFIDIVQKMNLPLPNK